MLQPLKFAPGDCVATPGALALAEEKSVNLQVLLNRHLTGDWGDLCEEDWQQNDAAVSSDQRILSAYQVGNKDKIWVITEWDRSATTFLLPSEY